ncbi:hypothetical protein CBER1_08851 [Cercospora berteroae]|uniref:Uncharacterized protein n=1 Tax=Cercospora berteroae TaxID=357750 RepID=A0A2S6CKG8_9PEZI|nr:hypothetical protein CBER1_08851 [Cercospora berteroae]
MAPTTRSNTKGSGPRRSDRLRAKVAEPGSRRRPGAKSTRPQPKKVAPKSKPRRSARPHLAHHPDPAPQDTVRNDLQQPTLLGIAPELRNMIYEYSLVKGGPVMIRPAAREPGLLRVCRQIRSEARGIWLTKNTFEYRVHGCDGRRISAFNRYNGENLPKPIAMRFYGHRNWGNVLAWARLVHQGKGFLLENAFPQVPVFSRSQETWDIVHAATMTAHNLSSWPWEKVEKNIELLRTVAGRVSRKWLV